MKNRLRKILIWLAILLGVPSVAFATFAFYGTQIGIVTLQNDSASEILDGTVQVCGTDHSTGNIPQGKAKSLWFIVSSEGDYKITLKFRSGKTLADNVGYTTQNFGNRDYFVVSEKGIKTKATPESLWLKFCRFSIQR